MHQMVHAAFFIETFICFPKNHLMSWWRWCDDACIAAAWMKVLALLSIRITVISWPRFKQKHHQQKRGDNPTDNWSSMVTIFFRVWKTRKTWPELKGCKITWGRSKVTPCKWFMVNRTSEKRQMLRSILVVLCTEFEMSFGVFSWVFPPPSDSDPPKMGFLGIQGGKILIFRTQGFQLSSI